MKLSTLIFCCGLAILLTTGCGGPKKPAGFPDLIPCTITVTQENAPVSGVTVRLIPKEEEANTKWPSLGLTDESGEAEIMTYGKFAGVPAGNYRIVLTKIEEEGRVEYDETKPNQTIPPIKQFSLIDVKYTKKDTTTLELNIEKKSVKETFDVGKPVRVLFNTIKYGGM